MAREATADHRLGSGPIEKSGTRGGGGTMDDVLERLGTVEDTVADIQSQVSGIAAVMPMLATKAEVASITATLPLLATKTEVASIAAMIPLLATKADIQATKADIASIAAVMPLMSTKGDIASIAAIMPLMSTKGDITGIENSMLRWLITTVIAAMGLVFVIAKYT
jgi:prophage DNA circulation protein